MRHGLNLKVMRIEWFLALLLATGASSARAQIDCAPAIETETLREVISAIDGYDTAAAPNQGLFVAEILLALARRVETEGGTRFRIEPDGFFTAWLDTRGVAANDAPVSMRRVLEFDQRFYVDIAPELRLGGPRPRQALAVRVSWPEGDDRPDHYEWEDTRSSPSVRMRQERLIRYLLLDFGDWVAYENMRGVAGQPTTGALGALFGILGMANIESSRHAVAADGTQIARSRSRKLFEFTTLATITPDGRAERGLPDDRNDLRALADRLDRDLNARLLSEWPEACGFEPKDSPGDQQVAG